MPRCDLLVWILVTKLAPFYYTKLDRLLVENGRYRELCSWRKDFKKEWRALEKRAVTQPVNDAYKPDAEKWVCTCPAFVKSRFLVCKHLIQDVEHVPPIFFLEVRRHRTTPFWRHQTLKVTLEQNHVDEGGSEVEVVDGEYDDDMGGVSEEEEPDVEEVVEARGEESTFEEAINANIDLIAEFLQGLQYQVQFRDQRMLKTLEREGAGFLRLAKACKDKERRLQSTRGGQTPSTWEKSTITAMFYRPRPTNAEMNT